jgi:putative transferase (TIGR04331 family)
MLDSMRKNGWNAANLEVMPNPWRDLGRMTIAAQYLDKLNEKLLNVLAPYLNRVHGLNASLRYWRVLIGPWLAWHLRTYYDRYVHLQEALRQHRGCDSAVLSDAFFVTPEDTGDFQRLLETDSYNFQIFSEMLKNLGYSFPTAPGVPDPKAGVASPSAERPRNKLTFSNSKAPVVMLHEMYCDPGTVNRIIQDLSPNACAFVAGQRRFSNLPRAEMSSTRVGLAQLPSGDEFESLFIKSLPKNFPVLWMEGFDFARHALIKPENVLPSVIVSANAWYDNEIFKFFAAHAGECGSRLVIVQHGGGYGVYRESFDEVLEERMADTFLVWGWSSDKKGKYRDAPCLQTSPVLSVSRQRLLQPKAKSAFFSTDSTPYTQVFRSQPALDQWETYFDWQSRFFKSLPAKLHSQVLYRPYLRDFGRGVQEALRTLAPSVEIEDMKHGGGQSFQRLFGSRLCVIDHNATTFLYSLALNVPTILYWDPEAWKARTEAEPYFNDLRSVGILWDTPEAAAAQVAAVHDDPMRWWNSPPVQAARQRFASRYASTTDDWLSEWKALLLEEIKLSQTPAQPTHVPETGAQTDSSQAAGAFAGPTFGYRIETWKPLAEMQQIEYSRYWNDVEEERKKEWWVLDGNFEKMESYLESSLLLPQLRQLLEFAKTRLGRSPEGRGADLAAGNLWAVPHILKAGNVEQIYAVECSVHRITQIGPCVLKNYGVPRDKVVLCLGSFYELKVPTGSLDFVFLSQAFHHADDPLRLLAEIRRVLRPGGLGLMIGEHIAETPQVHRVQLRDLRARLANAESRRNWKPILPADAVLGDHCYFEEEYDALFSCTGFSWQNLRMAGAKLQSFVLIRDNVPQGTVHREAGLDIGDRAQLSGALARLNDRFRRRS